MVNATGSGKQPISEIEYLRQRVAELEKKEALYQQAEKALRISEECLRMLFEHAPDAYYLIDLEGIFVDVNKPAEQMVGYRRDELMGKNLLELGIVSPDQIKKATRLLDRNALGQLGGPDEVILTRKYGEKATAEVRAFPIELHDRKLVLIIAQDITERKRAQEKLEMFSHAAAGAIDAIALTDLEGKIIFTNAAMEKTYGYKKEELLGKMVTCLNASEKMAGEIMATMLKTGSWEGEIEALKSNGDTFPALLSLSMVRDKTGTPLAMMGASRDITKSKRAEEALRESEEKLSAMLQSISDQITLTDKDLNILWANQTAREIFGENIIGKKCYQVFHRRQQPCDDCITLKVFEDGKAHKHETQVIDKYGNQLHFQCTASVAIKDRDGKPTAAIEISRDITEQKQAEAALRESEERYRSLINNVKLGILRSIPGPPGRILAVNPAMEEITGYSSDELMNMDIENLYVNLEERYSFLEKLLSARETVSRELHWKKKDGTEIVVKDNVTTVRDSDGNILHLDAIVEDITERKQMAEALRREKEFSENIITSSVDGIFAIDVDCNFTLWNPGMERITGIKKAKVLGKCAFYVFPHIEETGEDKFFYDALLGEITETAERPYLIPETGRSGFFDGYYSPLFHERGIIEGAFAIIRDITARHQAETKLVAQKEFIDRILSTSPNSVVVLGHDLHVKLANRAFREFFHQDEADILGKHLNDVIGEYFLPEQIVKVISSQQPNRNFTFNHTIDDSKRILVASITPMQEEEILIIFQDTTEESERQERLYLTDRLASIGEMASGVAHELNNPLTGIIGLSQIMMESEMPAGIAEDISDIYKEATRAAAVVKNMLTFARKHAAVRQMTQGNNILSDVLKLRAYEHRVHNITTRTDFDSALPEIMADYFQLQQVFLNIVLNAESAMVDANGKGTLTVSTEKTDGTVRVSFTDNGPGIAPQNIAHLFNPFFTTKEVGKGTGLGLSICYGVVTEHHGKISAQNNPEQGATFTVELPLVSDETEEIS